MEDEVKKEQAVPQETPEDVTPEAENVDNELELKLTLKLGTGS